MLFILGEKATTHQSNIFVTPVYITGAGIISAVGNDREEHRHALQQGYSGIAPLSTLSSGNEDVWPVGEVKRTSGELAYRLGTRGHYPRAALLGWHAAREAWQHSGLRLPSPWHIGFISGCATGGVDLTEHFFSSFLQDTRQGRLRDVVYHTPGAITDIIVEALGVSAQSTTISTGSTSGMGAIMLAARLIRQNKFDVVIAGGTEALSLSTLHGLHRMGLLDQHPSRPFDQSHDGLNPAEGAAYLVLTSEAVVAAEGLNVLAQVSGWASQQIGITATTEGLADAAVQTMQQTLTHAGLVAADIDYLLLQGSGVPLHDDAEAAATRRLFGDTRARTTAWQAATGHALAASGAMAAVLATIALQQQVVYPTLRFSSPIPDIGIFPQTSCEPVKLDQVMVNAWNLTGHINTLTLSRVS